MECGWLEMIEMSLLEHHFREKFIEVEKKKSNRNEFGKISFSLI